MSSYKVNGRVRELGAECVWARARARTNANIYVYVRESMSGREGEERNQVK